MGTLLLTPLLWLCTRCLVLLEHGCCCLEALVDASRGRLAPIRGRADSRLRMSRPRRRSPGRSRCDSDRGRRTGLIPVAIEISKRAGGGGGFIHSVTIPFVELVSFFVFSFLLPFMWLRWGSFGIVMWVLCPWGFNCRLLLPLNSVVQSENNCAQTNCTAGM